MSRKKIAVIGGGASALAFSSFIDTHRFDVTIYERNKALGRKFLVAGKGGFNLTHGESIEEMIGRYTPQDFLASCLRSFTNVDFRKWLASLEISTYVGSSNRVFPVKGIKPIKVLKVIEEHVIKRGVNVHYSYLWNGEPLGDITVYALGGGSWSVTGSDGSWTTHFDQTLPFRSSNCAFKVDWPRELSPNIEGKPLKNIVVRTGNAVKVGEVMLTAFGIEGGAIYALSEEIQSQLRLHGQALLTIDLKKDLTKEEIYIKLKHRSDSITDTLKRVLRLPKYVVDLIKYYVSKEEFIDPQKLTHWIKRFPLTLTKAAPLDEAISTMGGISIEQLTPHFELKSQKDHYCIGEMVGWNAPTGGYLLQACFSMGHFLATNLNASHPEKNHH